MKADPAFQIQLYFIDVFSVKREKWDMETINNTSSIAGEGQAKSNYRYCTIPTFDNVYSFTVGEIDFSD